MIGGSKNIVDIPSQYNTQFVLQGHQKRYKNVIYGFVTARTVFAY